MGHDSEVFFAQEMSGSMSIPPAERATASPPSLTFLSPDGHRGQCRENSRKVIENQLTGVIGDDQLAMGILFPNQSVSMFGLGI